MLKMSATQLATHLQTAAPLLLDVREPWGFDICHHGIRSQQVIWFLQQQALENLVNLDGGVDAWARTVDADMPVY